MSGTQCVVCGARTDAFLCYGCGEQVAYALAELPSLFRAVVDREVRATRVYRQTRWRLPDDEELAGLEEEHIWRMALIPSRLRDRAGRVTLPATALMTDMDAARLTDEARNTIGTWARHISETRGIEGPTEPIPAAFVVDVRAIVVRNRMRFTRETHIVAEARDHAMGTVCSWLMVNLDSIRYDEAAAEIHGQLLELKGKLARAVDSSPAWVFAGPCDDCKVDLYRQQHAARIVCDGQVTREPGCGREYTIGERTDWLLDSVADALVPLDALKAFLVPMGWRWPPGTTVAGWRLRMRLKVRSADIHGVELFRGGDVIDLLIEWETKDQERRARAC